MSKLVIVSRATGGLTLDVEFADDGVQVGVLESDVTASHRHRCCAEINRRSSDTSTCPVETTSPFSANTERRLCFTEEGGGSRARNPGFRERSSRCDCKKKPDCARWQGRARGTVARGDGRRAALRVLLGCRSRRGVNVKKTNQTNKTNRQTS